MSVYEETSAVLKRQYTVVQKNVEVQMLADVDDFWTTLTRNDFCTHST